MFVDLYEECVACHVAHSHIFFTHAHSLVHSVGGANIKVDIFGGSSPVAKVVDNQDGSYTITYTPGWADTYHVEVYLNGAKLDGSPFSIKATEK